MLSLHLPNITFFHNLYHGDCRGGSNRQRGRSINVIGETMKTSIKSRYTNEILDRIFRYFMRMVLHMQNSGIENLPLENDFEEPLNTFLDIAVDLIIDGQPPEITSLILDAEYDCILSGTAVSVKTAMSLRLIKELSWHIHYEVKTRLLVFFP